MKIFRGECLTRGFRLPASAAIHAENVARNQRNQAKLLRLIDEALAARRPK